MKRTLKATDVESLENTSIAGALIGGDFADAQIKCLPTGAGQCCTGIYSMTDTIACQGAATLCGVEPGCLICTGGTCGRGTVA